VGGRDRLALEIAIVGGTRRMAELGISCESMADTEEPMVSTTGAYGFGGMNLAPRDGHRSEHANGEFSAE